MSPPLPLNPMHVADEAATLDVLTGGNYTSLAWASGPGLPQRQVLSSIQRRRRISWSAGSKPEIDRHLRRW
jgi:alkanesulfonate monooxygenase SsuD/methylene tetrahydromethanopterin reductase-like flavin-dependent oxidoreductase (luciferase family)